MSYLWPVAADIARYIGDTTVNGHLVTVSSEAENNFIYHLIRGTRYSPWIGLSSTGKPGMFQWVNGEPLGYTKWAMGEPNNSRGNASQLREPYVRILDINNGTWNDQRSDYAPYIAEFESPLLRYRQISGPANGSMQLPGAYEVCYEVNNLITGEKQNCCFTVTVSCPSAPSASIGINAEKASSLKNNPGGLRVTTAANPSSYGFKLNISGEDKEPVNLQVTDINGNVIEVRKGLMPGQTLD